MSSFFKPSSAGKTLPRRQGAGVGAIWLTCTAAGLGTIGAIAGSACAKKMTGAGIELFVGIVIELFGGTGI